MKYWLVGILIIVTALIIAPPLYYHYIYPTSGDDTATHLLYFENMDTQNAAIYYEVLPAVSVFPLYWGQYAIGKFINLFPSQVSAFMWFNYIVLIIGMWIVGITVSKAVNYLAGMIAVLLVFGRSFLITLFNWGNIFDVFNIIILLPILLLCLHNINKNWKWRIGILLSGAMFAVFHVTGKYLYALIPIIVIYELSVYLTSRKWQGLSKWMKDNRFVCYSAGLCLAMVVAYLLKISIDPTRQWLDASILLSMIIAIIAGKILIREKAILVAGVLVVVVAICYPVVKNWCGNNSAIKYADKEAIEYVNRIDGKTYEVSPEITKSIYVLYINKTMVRYDADYIITRSTPMTETSAIATKDNNGKFKTDGYTLIKSFERNNIKTCVYGK